MNASEAFKRPRLIRCLRRRTRSSGLARLDDRLRAVEIGFLEQLEERSLAHDVEDHHVDLDRPASHRSERDRLLGDNRTERPDVGLVESPGYEPVDEARLADALLAGEADFELEGLLLGLHGRLPHHGTRGTQPGGYQAS